MKNIINSLIKTHRSEERRVGKECSDVCSSDLLAMGFDKGLDYISYRFALQLVLIRE